MRCIVILSVLFCAMSPATYPFNSETDTMVTDSTDTLDVLYNNGVEACNAGDDSIAVGYWSQAAEGGHAEARYDYALSLFNGTGVEQNYAEAFAWFMKASEQKHVEAQFSVGYCYENGIGVEPSFAEAEKWYTMAAGE